MAELIYLYHGKNDFLVSRAIEDKIRSLAVDDINIIRYDLLENSSDDVLEDLQTVSFFAERKIIVVDNLQALAKEEDDIIKAWTTYLKKPNPDVTLIIALDEILPESTPLGEALFNHAYIEDVPDIDKKDLPDFIKKHFQTHDYQISDEAVEALIERVGHDLYLFCQEAEKLMLFAYEGKRIQTDDVIGLVSRNLEENIFELTNALLDNNQAKTIEIFYDLVALNEDPLRILSNIAGKIRELMHAKLLLDKGYRQDQIANHFNIKSGRAYYLVKNAKALSLDMLERHLKKLALLDFEIKSGKIEKKLGVELYLLGA
ncbi:MAG: DNA polymerase III subunit delta [Acholeplasmataceae bacterium]|nr:MAG: DNA polymerase III subunit delta [Acholeplasmataceae bacterium]